jgi:hypothetical protein
LQVQASAPIVLTCACAAAQIPVPIGSTENTRYTWRRCCARIQRQRNIESLLKFYQTGAKPNEAANGLAPGLNAVPQRTVTLANTNQS